MTLRKGQALYNTLASEFTGECANRVCDKLWNMSDSEFDKVIEEWKTLVTRGTPQ